eukprot:gene29345-38424_t
MSGIAVGRLSEERKNWRKDHPAGFYARPVSKADGSSNIMEWHTGIPGKEGSDWEGGVYKVTVRFSPDYPSKPPTCRFEPPIYHPNVFSSGDICLSILKEDGGWRPGITVKEILIGIQELLTDPNPESPANSEAAQLFKRKPAEYKKKLREQAAKFVPDS